jgi:hypothetical protein
LKDLESAGVKGIGAERVEELKVVGLDIVSDLATASAKGLSQKTHL